MSSERCLFYRLSKTSLEKTLPSLVAKIYKQEKQILILSSSAQDIQALDQLLWTYTPVSFLPHGCEGQDTKETLHPIWISTTPVPHRKIWIAVHEASLPFTSTSDIVVLFSAYEASECTWAQKLYATYAKRNPLFWEQAEAGWKEGPPNFSVIV